MIFWFLWLYIYIHIYIYIYMCVYVSVIWHDMDFGSFLVTPCILTGCPAVMSKQGYDSMIRAVDYNRYVTGGRPHDENHTVSFRQSAENRSRTRGTQPIRGISDELERGCHRCHICLWLYMSLQPSLIHYRNINPFKDKMWEIYFYKELCSFVHWS